MELALLCFQKKNMDEMHEHERFVLIHQKQSLHRNLFYFMIMNQLKVMKSYENY